MKKDPMILIKELVRTWYECHLNRFSHETYNSIATVMQRNVPRRSTCVTTTLVQKAPTLIVVTPSGMIMLQSDLQPSNA